MFMQETIQFISDGYQLTGTLHRPDRRHPPVVIGCHGLLADRRSPKQIALGEALNHIGIAYLRFDHRGCGDSQGHLQPETLLDSRCRDLYHAMDRMQSHPNVGAVIGLFGSSFGGTVALATAAGCSVPAIVTYGAPAHSHAIGEAAGEQVRSHNALADRDLSMFVFDIRQKVRSLKNILVMHGANDEIVPPEHARSIFEAAGEPKKLIFFDGGDHRMSHPDHQTQFIAACTVWFETFGRAGM